MSLATASALREDPRQAARARMAAGAAMLALASAWGCAASPVAPPRPSVRALDSVRGVAIVASGETRFTIVEHRAEPGRTFDQVVKWTPYAWLRPLGALVHSGINWVLDAGRVETTVPDVGDVSPRAIVGEVLARRLRSTGAFEEVRRLEAEPLGEERRPTEGVLRVMVPAWGFVRVRQGPPDLVSAFADVRAELVIPGTGVVVWENTEDVTGPERLPLDSYAGDRRFARQQLMSVLEQAGQRLATELLYARGTAR
jgi:hypothetical protein